MIPSKLQEPTFNQKIDVNLIDAFSFPVSDIIMDLVL